jgi:hypothetical protein
LCPSRGRTGVPVPSAGGSSRILGFVPSHPASPLSDAASQRKCAVCIARRRPKPAERFQLSVVSVAGRIRSSAEHGAGIPRHHLVESWPFVERRRRRGGTASSGGRAYTCPCSPSRAVGPSGTLAAAGVGRQGRRPRFALLHPHSPPDPIAGPCCRRVDHRRTRIPSHKSSPSLLQSLRQFHRAIRRLRGPALWAASGSARSMYGATVGGRTLPRRR